MLDFSKYSKIVNIINIMTQKVYIYIYIYISGINETKQR